VHSCTRRRTRVWRGRVRALVLGGRHPFRFELIDWYRHVHTRSLVLGSRHNVCLDLKLCGELRVGHADSLVIRRLAYPFRLELIVWQRYVHGRSLVLGGRHPFRFELIVWHRHIDGCSLVLGGRHPFRFELIVWDSLVLGGLHCVGCSPYADLDPT